MVSTVERPMGRQFSTTRRPAAMTPDELRAIVRRNIESGRFRNVQGVAEALGVTNPTVYRWLNGVTPICLRSAEAIKAKLA